MVDPEDALSECLDAFYDEKLESKIVASRRILMLTMDFKNMEFLLNHGMLQRVERRPISGDDFADIA